MMRKVFIIVLLCMFVYPSLQAHTWTSSKRLCYLWHKKFEAHAENRKYMGYIYNGPWTIGQHWAQACYDADKGCTRPRHAYCESYFNFPNDGWKVSYANVTLDVGGNTQHLNWYNDWRLTPGVYDDIPVDTNKLNELDKDGYGGIDVSGNITIDSNDFLQIRDFTGKMYIKPNSNHLVTYHILVVKYNENISEEEALELDEERSHLRFTNILAEGSITVTKDGVEVLGFLNDFLNADDIAYSDDTSFGANFNSGEGRFQYDLKRFELKEGESLELITYADGGLDDRLVAPSQNRTIDNGYLASDEAYSNAIEILPNPASSRVNINYVSANEGERVSIAIYDVTGKLVMDLYDGNVGKGMNHINDVDISNLTSGMYFVKARSGTHASTTKLVIQ